MNILSGEERRKETPGLNKINHFFKETIITKHFLLMVFKKESYQQNKLAAFKYSVKKYPILNF